MTDWTTRTTKALGKSFATNKAAHTPGYISQGNVERVEAPANYWCNKPTKT